METGESAPHPDAYQSVEDIFNWLQSVVNDDPKKLELKFHPKLGYPTFIDYNQSDQMVDEELLMRMENIVTG